MPGPQPPSPGRRSGPAPPGTWPLASGILLQRKPGSAGAAYSGLPETDTFCTVSEPGLGRGPAGRIACCVFCARSCSCSPSPKMHLGRVRSQHVVPLLRAATLGKLRSKIAFLRMVGGCMYKAGEVGLVRPPLKNDRLFI